METYNGVLTLRFMDEGSKSEAVYAYLKLDSGEEYMLYRQDVYPANDDFFVPFNGQYVLLKGELESDSILVEEVQIVGAPAVTKQSAPSRKKCPKRPWNQRKSSHLTLYALMKSRNL